jgi:hypothetical protein
MGRKRRTARLAARETESWRKAGRLCSLKDYGFSEDFSEEAQEATQGKTLRSRQENTGNKAALPDSSQCDKSRLPPF